MSSSSPDTLDIISSSGNFQETPTVSATTGPAETQSTEITGMTTGTSCAVRSQPAIRMSVSIMSSPDVWTSTESNLPDVDESIQHAEANQREYEISEEAVGPSNPPAHLLWFHNKLERERKELLNRDGDSPDLELVRHWYNLTAERDHLFRVAYCQNTREELLKEIFALEKRCLRLLKVATCPAPVITHFRKYLNKVIDIIPLVNNHLEKYSHPNDYAEYRSISQQISNASTPEFISAPHTGETGDLASEPGIFVPVENLHQIDIENPVFQTSYSTYLPSYYSRSYNRTYNGLRYDSWYVPSSSGSAPAHVRVPINGDAHSLRSEDIQSKVADRERPTTADFIEGVAVDLPSDGASIELLPTDPEAKSETTTANISSIGGSAFKPVASTSGNTVGLTSGRPSVDISSRADITTDTTSCAVVAANTSYDASASTVLPSNDCARAEMPSNKDPGDASNGARTSMLHSDEPSNASARIGEPSGTTARADITSSASADDYTSKPIGGTKRLESEEFFSPIAEGTSVDSLASASTHAVDSTDGESTNSRQSPGLLFRFSDEDQPSQK